jgi:hypothetical protein
LKSFLLQIETDSNYQPKHVDLSSKKFGVKDFDMLLKQSRKDLENMYKTKEEL